MDTRFVHLCEESDEPATWSDIVDAVVESSGIEEEISCDAASDIKFSVLMLITSFLLQIPQNYLPDLLKLTPGLTISYRETRGAAAGDVITDLKKQLVVLLNLWLCLIQDNHRVPSEDWSTRFLGSVCQQEFTQDEIEVGNAMFRGMLFQGSIVTKFGPAVNQIIRLVHQELTDQKLDALTPFRRPMATRLWGYRMTPYVCIYSVWNFVRPFVLKEPLFGQSISAFEALVNTFGADWPYAGFSEYPPNAAEVQPLALFCHLLHQDMGTTMRTLKMATGPTDHRVRTFYARARQSFPSLPELSPLPSGFSMEFGSIPTHVFDS